MGETTLKNLTMNYKTRDSEDRGTCLECGSGFNGRSNKKFCCLACKNSFNNRRLRTIRNYRNNTIAKLNRNYEILEMLINEKARSAGLEELRELGFEDSFITGRRIGARRHEECSCFDIVYCRTGSKIFDIRRRDLTRHLSVPSQDPSNLR